MTAPNIQPTSALLYRPAHKVGIICETEVTDEKRLGTANHHPIVAKEQPAQTGNEANSPQKPLIAGQRPWTSAVEYQWCSS